MTNNKQLTAVELFIEELEEKGKAYEENQVVRTINICIDVSDYMELKQQAKAMHKTEQGKTWDAAMDNFKARGENYVRAYGDFDEYYKETYGGGEQ
jgi:hypothetical protein